MKKNPVITVFSLYTGQKFLMKQEQFAKKKYGT